MRLYPALRYTLQDLAYDWGRTTLTILTLILLTAIFLISSAFSGALRTRRSSFAETANNLFVLSAAILDPMESTLDVQVLDTVTERTLALFGDQAVQSVSPLILRNMRIEGYVLQVAAAQVEDLEDVYQVHLLEGDWPVGADQIVVSPAVLQLTHRRRGDILKIYGRDFSIQGVISAPGNRAAVWMPYQAGADLFSRQRGFQIGVLQLAPGLDPNRVQSALEADPAISGRYAVYLEQQYAAKIFQSLRDFYQLAEVFQILALLVITFGAYHSAYLTLTERSNQLATLRAMGFSDSSLGRLLVARSSLLGLIAYPLAAALVYIYLRLTFSSSVVFYDALLELQLTPDLLVSGLALCLTFICLGAGISIWEQSRHSVKRQAGGEI